MTHVTGKRVILVAFAEAGGPEDGYAGTIEVEALEAAQYLEKNFDGAFEVLFAAAPALQEQLLGAFDFAEQGIGCACFVTHR